MAIKCVYFNLSSYLRIFILVQNFQIFTNRVLSVDITRNKNGCGHINDSLLEKFMYKEEILDKKLSVRQIENLAEKLNDGTIFISILLI